MFQDSPIYDRLVAERGDVPDGVRREADRLRRELEVAMMPWRPNGPAPGVGGLPPAAPTPAWERVPQLPGPGSP
ncbi:hypothetical protein ACFY0F_30450 [Streptomyces sp. NPDC001544]|uniref:hypothetical protein n=1 Tax=Streptomyces sp. NPDC001544 TaxID=3364584 RepID=UPI0036A5BE47